MVGRGDVGDTPGPRAVVVVRGVETDCGTKAIEVEIELGLELDDEAARGAGAIDTVDDTRVVDTEEVETGLELDDEIVPGSNTVVGTRVVEVD